MEANNEEIKNQTKIEQRIDLEGATKTICTIAYDEICEYLDGKKVRRFQYAVTDPNSSQEKIWPVSKRASEQIDAFLIEGHTLLKIQRIGSGKETRYHIMPA